MEIAQIMKEIFNLIMFNDNNFDFNGDDRGDNSVGY